MLHKTINLSSLHDCLSTEKKIERAGLEGPVIVAMNAVMAEAARELKDFFVKGRAPIDTLRDWQRHRPELFSKRIYNHAGSDR